MTSTNNLNVACISIEVMRYLRQLHDVAKFEKVCDQVSLFEDLYHMHKGEPQSDKDDKSVSDVVAAINLRYGAMCSELKRLREEVVALYGADTDEKECAVLDMLETAWQSYKFVFVDHEFKE